MSVEVCHLLATYVVRLLFLCLEHSRILSLSLSPCLSGIARDALVAGALQETQRFLHSLIGWFFYLLTHAL